jgi:hypothetical protein
MRISWATLVNSLSIWIHVRPKPDSSAKFLIRNDSLAKRFGKDNTTRTNRLHRMYLARVAELKFPAN